MRRRALSLAAAVLLPTLGFLAGAPPAEAAVSNASANWLGQVSDTRDQAHISTTGFWTSDERSNWVTGAKLELDITPGGSAYYNSSDARVIDHGNGVRTLPAGTTISSHLIHGDVGKDTSPEVQAVCPDAAERQAPDGDGGQWFCAVSGVVYFDEAVLGVIATQDGLTQTDSIVRGSNTFAAHNLPARGLEVVDGFTPRNIGERVEVYGNRVEFTLSLANRVDQIRVITASTDRDPIVGCQGRAIDEGDPPPTLTGTVRDPDENDAASRVSFSPLGYGNFYWLGAQERWEWTPFPANADDGPTDSRPVSITVRDLDGDTASASCNYVVRNVAPDIVAVPEQVIDEGQTATQTFEFTDPGADEWTAEVKWSDQASPVSVPVSGKSLTISRSFDDDDPTNTPQDTYTATIWVDDGDGGIDDYVHTVVVRNVAPVIDPVADVTIDEGESVTQVFTFDDPGDDEWTAEVIWDDESAATPVTVDQDAKSLTISRAFPDDDPTATPQDDYVATVTVRDDDGGEHQQTLRVTVDDVAPVVAPIEGAEIDEGQGITRTVSFTDVGVLDTHEVVVDYGDGTVENLSVDPETRTAVLDHIFVDDDPTATPVDTYTVKVTVTDDDTLSEPTSFDVIVHDVAPDIEITSPLTGELFPVGSTVELVAPFDDPGLADTFTCDVEWDDPAAPGVETFAGSFDGSTGEGDCDASHTFTEAGVYSVRVTVTDDDTLSDADEILIVVYDPSAGFVTGGGQIDSPEGAYVADPSLTGRATFGFNAKYKKGATVPQGSTEFQFRAGDLNFHSNDLQWLVVTGNKTKAQFKGVGTINGSGEYGFMLTAYDLGNGQGVDQLRMKIWDRSTGDLVYDNSLGSPDDVDTADPMTIARGQIQIH